MIVTGLVMVMVLLCGGECGFEVTGVLRPVLFGMSYGSETGAGRSHGAHTALTAARRAPPAAHI
ncbi:hypothetical protein ADK38_16965, partial [Streptomyces varsoviensis]